MYSCACRTELISASYTSCSQYKACLFQHPRVLRRYLKESIFKLRAKHGRQNAAPTIDQFECRGNISYAQRPHAQCAAFTGSNLIHASAEDRVIPSEKMWILMTEGFILTQ